MAPPPVPPGTNPQQLEGPVGMVSVVCTGAPGSGKSTALRELGARFEAAGYRVYKVQENATMIFKNTGGFDPAWVDQPEQIAVQKTLFEVQVSHEEATKNIASLRPTEPAIILLDRGLQDGSGFCTPTQWTDILRVVGTTKPAILGRYDMVLNLQSVAALGSGELYDFGLGSSNPERFHNRQQALDLIPRLTEAYRGHPRLKHVKATEILADKMDFMFDTVMQSMPDRMIAAARARAPAAAAAAAAPAPVSDAVDPFAAPPVDPTPAVDTSRAAMEADLAKLQQQYDQLRQQLEAQASGPVTDGAAARAAEITQANRQAMQAALRNGIGLRVRGPEEPIDLIDDAGTEADEDKFGDLDEHEPFAPVTEQQRRMQVVMDGLEQEWPARKEWGIKGITPDIAAGATGVAYTELGIGAASASAPLKHTMHRLGLNGCAYPVRASAADRALLRTAASLRLFMPKGVYEMHQRKRTFRVAESSDGGLMLADGTTSDNGNPMASCRLIWFLADMRLSWMLSIADDAHPHFLPRSQMTAAREYVRYLGLLELEYDYSAVMQLDDVLMFERLSKTWEFDMPIPAMIVDTVTGRRPAHAQQCAVCMMAGHALSGCPKVTGTPLFKPSGGGGGNGNGNGGNGNGTGGNGYDNSGNPVGGGKKHKRDANNGQSGAKPCFKWNLNEPCVKTPCRFAHKCQNCGGSHRKTSTKCKDAAAPGGSPQDE